MNLPKLSVVVPTYNEELAIEENINKLVSALNDLQKNIGLITIREWELVLVNDGSSDQTLAIVQAAAQKEPRIKIVSYLPNRGRGFAIKQGFKAAKGDFIVVTESDLNWGTEIIGQFADELAKGTDIVIASPHMPGGKMENVPFLRWALSYFGNKIFSWALPGRWTMVTGMTRGYRREVLNSLDLESDDKELHVEIIYKALDLGYKVVEIPAVLKWKKPTATVKVRKSNFKIRHIAGHLLLSFLVRPFILFGGVGFLLMGIGTIMGFYLLYLSLSGMAVAGRPMLFAAVLLIIIGMLILMFGFLAHQNRDLKRQLVRLQRFIREK